MKFKIETPVRTYNGLSAGVPFTQGVGYTDSEERMRWFKSKGYKVTELQNQEVEPTQEIEEEELEINQEDLEESEEEVEEVEKPKTTNSRKIRKVKK